MAFICIDSTVTWFPFISRPKRPTIVEEAPEPQCDQAGPASTAS